MPVRKLRSITDELEPPPPASPADNLRAAFDLVEFCGHLHPWKITRGVQHLPDHPWGAAGGSDPLAGKPAPIVEQPVAVAERPTDR